MSRFEPLKYYSSMQTAQLLRILDHNRIPKDHLTSILTILYERELAVSKAQRDMRDIEKTRPKKHSNGMFGRRVKLTSRKGKILQGGRVNPK